MIISFGTTCKLSKKLSIPDPLLAGIKTVTRRNWTNEYVNKFIKNIDKWHDAYNAAPYAKGKKIGSIKLLNPPYTQRIGDMTKDDLFKEGNMWNSVPEFAKALKCSLTDEVWVIEFQFKEAKKLTNIQHTESI